MIALPKPEVILTHESDLDGLLSGLLLQRLARKLFACEVRLEACHYNLWRQRQLRERTAWACDFAFEPRMDRPGWVVLDHHATEVSAKEAILFHDLGKSASLICYERCCEHGLGTPELDRLVHLSNVADLFLEDDPDFALANDYAHLVKNYQFWSLHALIEGQPERLLNHPLLEVMEVKRRVENPLGYEWSRRNVTAITTAVGFVDTVVGNINLIVHQLLERQATPHAVLCTVFIKSTRTVIVSFRSRNGEALKAAQQFQGGGHANAAGATLPRHVQNATDAVHYLRAVLAPEPAKDAPLNSLAGLFAPAGVKER